MSPTFDLSCVSGLSNQLDGDPDRLDQMVRIFRTNADVMDQSAGNLERLRSGTSEMVSQAFEKAAKKAYEVESGIRAAAYYYRQVADAVGDFSPVLREAQRKAPGYLDQLHQAEGRKAVAESDYERARHYARNVDPAVQQQGVDLANQASSRYQSADSALNDARGALRAAASQVKEANDAAATRVKSATDNAGLKDSVWDHLAKIAKVIGEALVAIGKFIWENLDTILLVLTIVSFFIPGGPAVMGAIRAVMTVLKVLSAIKTTIDMAQEGWEIVEAAKDGDWGTAGRKALGIAASIGVRYATKKLAHGLGRKAGKALYSLDKDGKLTTTATGRAINRAVTTLGPAIKNADGSEPVRYISRSIHRTTKVITDVSEWTIKKGIKMVTKPIIDDLKEPPRASTSRKSTLPTSCDSGLANGYSGGGGGGGAGGGR